MGCQQSKQLLDNSAAGAAAASATSIDDVTKVTTMMNKSPTTIPNNATKDTTTSTMSPSVSTAQQVQVSKSNNNSSSNDNNKKKHNMKKKKKKNINEESTNVTTTGNTATTTMNQLQQQQQQPSTTLQQSSSSSNKNTTDPTTTTTAMTKETTTTSMMKKSTKKNPNTTKPNTTKPTIRTSDKLYKALFKLLQQAQSQYHQQQQQQQQQLKIGDVVDNTKAPHSPKQQQQQSSPTSVLLFVNDTTSATTASTTTAQYQSLLEASKLASNASYRHAITQCTPLHIAVQLVDFHSYAIVQHFESLQQQQKEKKETTTTNSDDISDTSSFYKKKEYYETHSLLYQIIYALIQADPNSITVRDQYGNLPLHYCIAPSLLLLLHPSTCRSATTTTTTTPSKKKKQRNHRFTPNKTPQQSTKEDEDMKVSTNEKGVNGNTNNNSTTIQQEDNNKQTPLVLPAYIWSLRTLIVKLLLVHDPTTTTCYNYLLRNDVVYQMNSTKPNNIGGTTFNYGCTPLYRIVQLLPNDPSIQYSPLLEYVHMILKFVVSRTPIPPPPPPMDGIDKSDSTQQNSYYGTPMVSMGNASDGDKVMGLLYRIFTKQFDLSEQFFTGDNSRPHVVQHRLYYKRSANTTWKLIELLLKHQQHKIHLVTTTSAENDPNCNKIPLLDPCAATTAVMNPNQQNYIKPTYRIVHRAVQGSITTVTSTTTSIAAGCQTPPDLLRYIIETNADQLTVRDELGNLPIHYAAAAIGGKYDNDHTNPHHKLYYPSFYNKFVIDELLYKYPDAASMVDANGNYPLTIAIQSTVNNTKNNSNKTPQLLLLGGGIKSLYDTYPDAIQQIMTMKSNRSNNYYSRICRALIKSSSAITNDQLATDDDYDETDGDDFNEEKKVSSTKSNMSVVQGTASAVAASDNDDDQYNAIMLVQNENVDISEVVISMWAHEEDAGVQLLGCVAIVRLLLSSPSSATDSNGNKEHVISIALSAVPAVVNAMKAHPNEAIVQEKACHTLRYMASTDGLREVSFVASGAVAAIVGAMQAHVSDPKVQEEASAALGQILHYGGSDRATVISSVSGVTALLNAMAAHPSVGIVQYEVCNTLFELMNYKSTAYISELPLSQIEALLDYAKTHYPNECTNIVEQLLLRLT